MIIIDSALERRQESGKPINVGVIGAGYMGRGVVLQIETRVPGMRVAAIYNRTPARAEQAYLQAGIENVRHADSVAAVEDAVKQGVAVVTDNPFLVCEAQGIDAIVEVTGEVEFGVHVVMKAMDHGKHVVLMNAELDGTIGPILKTYADKAGVVYTNVDGDQPGVIMNLYRYVKSIGVKPVLCGNIKGLQDPYRTPETQRAYAEKFKQQPRMVTSFADGTKISFEMAVVANATGFKVGKRGMYGFECKHVNDTPALFPHEQMLETGLVDYVLGAEPPGGIFVIGYHDDPVQQQYLQYYKMGDGPFYVFYTPYHLCHLEVPLTIARAVDFADAAVTPEVGPVVDVITAAKRDLVAGEELDGIGGFTCYGVAENAVVTVAQNFLPMGLAEGCRLVRDVPRDHLLTYDDVEVPAGRECDRLRMDQNKMFFGA